MVDNVEQEIWDDFKDLSGSSVEKKLSYSCASSHFNVAYEDRNSLVSSVRGKKLLYDEDFAINEFLLKSDYKNIDWGKLEKLYNHSSIEFSSDKILIPQSLYLKIPNEKAALDYLIDMRWGSLPVCPRCESKNISSLQGNFKVFKCRKCLLKFSEKVGTIFQNTKLNLLTWYEAITLLKDSKTNKISSAKIANTIKVTQMVAWKMSKKIQDKINQVFIYELLKNINK